MKCDICRSGFLAEDLKVIEAFGTTIWVCPDCKIDVEGAERVRP